MKLILKKQTIAHIKSLLSMPALTSTLLCTYCRYIFSVFRGCQAVSEPRINCDFEALKVTLLFGLKGVLVLVGDRGSQTYHTKGDMHGGNGTGKESLMKK